MARRRYTNTAPPTSLTGDVNGIVVTLPVADGSQFPDTPFTIAINRGNATEEVCLVTNKTSNSLTVTRGYDGTSGQAHTTGTPVEHVSVAMDFDEANVHINDSNRDDHAQYLTADRHNALDHSAVFATIGIPVGAVLPFAGSVAPSANWALCDGAAVSRTTYSDLFSVVGTTYGTGDGTTTFNLPDLRGRVPMGRSMVGRTTNTDTYIAGKVVGAERHTLSAAEMPSHTHVQNPHSHSMPVHRHTGTTNSDGAHHHRAAANNFFLTYAPLGSNEWNVDVHASQNLAGFNFYPNTMPGDGAHSHQFTTAYVDPGNTHASAPTNQSTGGGQSHNNVQPSLVMNYLIRVS